VQTASPVDPALSVRWRSVLVAIDGSRHSALALQSGIALATPMNAALTVISVVPPVSRALTTFAGGPAYQDLEGEVEREAARTLERAIQRVPAGLPVTKRLRLGSPGREIVAQIAEGRHDVVVMGSRGLGRFGGLVGSTSQHVLHHAGVAVVVVHASREAATGE
jgi:nucleotide-binding universal stress UspA family protein